MIRALKQKFSTLYVTFSVRDCAALRHFGFPATTATGLSTLRSDSLSQFCRAFHCHRGLTDGAPKLPADFFEKEFDDEVPESLIVVDWQPFNWDRASPCDLEELATHLQRINGELQVDLPQVLHWRPTAGDLDTLAFIRESGTYTEFHSKLEHISNQLPDFLQYRPGTLISRPTLAERYEKLYRASEAGHSESFASTMKRELSKHFDNSVVLPLFQKAEDGSDLVERVEFINLANLSRLLHDEQIEVTIQRARHRSSGNARISEEEIKALETRTDRMVRLARELHKYAAALNSRKSRTQVVKSDRPRLSLKTAQA